MFMLRCLGQPAFDMAPVWMAVLNVKIREKVDNNYKSSKGLDCGME